MSQKQKSVLRDVPKSGGAPGQKKFKMIFRVNYALLTEASFRSKENGISCPKIRSGRHFL